MAHDVSGRPASGRGHRASDRHRPPRRRGTGVTVARAVAGALLALAWLLPAPALGAQGLHVTTPYPAVAVAPGSDVAFDIAVSSATPGRVNLALQGVPQGWTATLRGGGFVVDGVQATAEEPAQVTLEITVPGDATGTQDIVVRATSGGLTTDLPLTLRIEAEAAGDVSLTTDFPSLRGASDATFPFSLTLSNNTPEDLTFVVEAQVPADAGPGWQATAQVSGQDQAASALVEAGSNVTIDVEVTPAENAAAGAYPVTVTATGAGSPVTAELQVEITGSYSMTLTTPDQRLNTSGSAGSAIRQTLLITNTGTAPLEGLTMSQTVPTNWRVTYEPAEIPAIPPGADPVEVTAVITPSGDAIAGDYSVSIDASNENAEASQDIRVTVETSLLWGLIGVALIVAVLAGLWFVFQRYGRR